MSQIKLSWFSLTFQRLQFRSNLSTIPIKSLKLCVKTFKFGSFNSLDWSWVSSVCQYVSVVEAILCICWFFLSNFLLWFEHNFMNLIFVVFSRLQSHSLFFFKSQLLKSSILFGYSWWKNWWILNSLKAGPICANIASDT